MKKTYIIIILLSFITVASYSQETDKSKYFKPETKQSKGLLNLNYVMGFPSGDFKDFISEKSYRGITIDYRRFLTDYLSVGGYTGWNGFYEKTDRATYTFDNGAITGVLYNYLYVLPIYAGVYYYPFPGDPVQPFAGLAFGAVYVNRESQMGILTVYEDSWHFGIAPELGFFIPFGKAASSGVITSGRFNSTFYNQENIKTLKYFQWTIGLSVFL